METTNHNHYILQLAESASRKVHSTNFVNNNIDTISPCIIFLWLPKANEIVHFTDKETVFAV